MNKRLTKSTDKKISGVCAGFAEYLDTDPTLIRALYAIVVFLTGIFPFVIAYFVLAMIMPDKH